MVRSDLRLELYAYGITAKKERLLRAEPGCRKKGGA